MSSVLVVVIVGVIIVAITAATVRDRPQPPTPDQPRSREPVPWGTPSPAHLSHDLAEDDPSSTHRARSALVLGLGVVILGSLAAGLLGAIVYVGAHAMNKALG